MNTEFCNNFRNNGLKYQIFMSDTSPIEATASYKALLNAASSANEPIHTSKAMAIRWIRQIKVKTRGQEFQGTFNPLAIGELFREQSSNWERLAINHAEDVARVCERFLNHLLSNKCPQDVKARIWSSQILDTLKARRKAVFRELERIMEDTRGFPINYNHHYTDTIHKRRQECHTAFLADSLESATEHSHLVGCNSIILQRQLMSTKSPRTSLPISILTWTTSVLKKLLSIFLLFTRLVSIFLSCLLPSSSLPSFLSNTSLICFSHPGIPKDLHCDHHNPGH